MQIWDDVLAELVEQEAPLLGFEVDWFPIDRPECAGGKNRYYMWYVMVSPITYHSPGVRRVKLSEKPCWNFSLAAMVEVFVLLPN